MSLRPSQPQSIGGVLDTTFLLYKSALVRVLPLSALIVIASSLPTIFLAANSTQINPDDPLAVLDLVLNPTFAALYLVTLLSTLCAFAALLTSVDAIGNEQGLSIGAALQQAVYRVPTLLSMSILFGLAVAIGMFLLVLPGLFLSVSLLPSYCLATIERKGPIKSLLGSHRLVWGNWWRTMATLTVGFVIVMVLYFLGALLIGLLMPAIGLASGSSLATSLLSNLAISGVMSLIGTPFFVSLAIAIYWDLKLRKEGGDLAARVGMLDAT